MPALYGFDQLEAHLEGADLLGTDLAQTPEGDLALDQGGLKYAYGQVVALSDIAERIRTLVETEFYDRLFGLDLDNFLEAPDTPMNRLELLTQLELAVRKDPRVKKKSVKAEVVSWNDQPRELTIRISWYWIDLTWSGNLVVTLSESGGVEVLVKDYRPTKAVEGS